MDVEVSPPGVDHDHSVLQESGQANSWKLCLSRSGNAEEPRPAIRVRRSAPSPLVSIPSPVHRKPHTPHRFPHRPEQGNKAKKPTHQFRLESSQTEPCTPGVFALVSSGKIKPTATDDFVAESGHRKTTARAVARRFLSMELYAVQGSSQ